MPPVPIILQPPIPTVSHRRRACARGLPLTKAAQLGIYGLCSWTCAGNRRSLTCSWPPASPQGLSLIAASGVVVAEASAFESVQPTQHADRGGDPVATWAADVEPGIYFLRQQLASGLILERTLVASAGTGARQPVHPARLQRHCRHWWQLDCCVFVAGMGQSLAILMARKSAPRRHPTSRRYDEQVTRVEGRASRA